MELWRERFRTRFKELKQTEGMTQEKLGERLGMTQGGIGHWLRGERTPDTIEAFRRLEDALGLPPGALLVPAATDASQDAIPMAYFDLTIVADVLEALEAEGRGLPRLEKARIFAEHYYAACQRKLGAASPSRMRQQPIS